MAAKKKTTKASKTTKTTKAAPKPKAKPRRKASAEAMPKMEDVAKAKGKQEFVKVARTKNKKKPRTWVIVYKLMTGCGPAPPVVRSVGFPRSFGDGDGRSGHRAAA